VVDLPLKRNTPAEGIQLKDVFIPGEVILDAAHRLCTLIRIFKITSPMAESQEKSDEASHVQKDWMFHNAWFIQQSNYT